MRSNGGLSGAKNTVSNSAASGIWSIRDVQREKGAGNWVTIPFTITATLLGGGGGGGTGSSQWAGGGSGGGYLVADFLVVESFNYSTTVGAAGAGQTACNNSDHRTVGKGGNSIFSSSYAGGGQGGNSLSVGASGIGGTNITTGSSNVVTTYVGQTAAYTSGDYNNAGGNNGLRNGNGTTTYGAGAAGGPNSQTGASASGKGNGGAGGPSCQTPTAGGGNGSIGVVILTYPDSRTITIGAGLTGTTAAPSGGFKTTTITAGTGNVSWA